MKYKLSDIDYIKSKIITDETTGCWNWTGCKNPKGYGKAGKQEHRHKGAHRLSYEAFVGPIPEKISVLHNCHNPACCCPDHLRLGTHDDNMRDKANIGTVKGEGHPSHKLTLEQVHEIREMKRGVDRLLSESIQSLAKRFNVSVACIKAVRSRTIWSWA